MNSDSRPLPSEPILIVVLGCLPLTGKLAVWQADLGIMSPLPLAIYVPSP